jgi:hypothetical protein
MKVIHLDEAISSFQKIFKEVHGLKQKVVFWQVFQGHRTICESLLISYNHESRLLNLLPGDSEIILSHPLFFYLEDQQVIFKSTVESRNATNIVVKWPPEIHLLDEKDEIPAMKNRVQTFWSSKSTAGTERINDLVRVKSMKERSSRDQDFLQGEFDHKTLDEEDKIFADKRESPRVRPKADKLVKLVRKGDAKINIMKLFDLSRGGMGFLTHNPDQFQKGMEVFVTGFDAFDLDDPLVGIIMSQRAVDESNVEFKIGIRFSEGQE